MLKRLIIGTVFLGITGLAAGWILGWFREDPVVAEVRELQTKLIDPNLKDQERQALMQQMRSKMESLSPDARRSVWQGTREGSEQRAEARIEQILKLPPAELTRVIDADIDRMEKQTAERAKRQQQREAQGKSAAGAGNGRGSAPSAQGGPGRRGTNPTDDQRVSRLRSRLDRSTPEMRAKRSAYTQLINDRRKQRGLPPMTGRGGRG